MTMMAMMMVKKLTASNGMLTCEHTKLGILRMPTMENMEFPCRGHYCNIRHAFWHTLVDGNNFLPQDQLFVYIAYIHGTTKV
jgi:hypothetical protein